jgi:hypothetical protein
MNEGSVQHLPKEGNSFLIFLTTEGAVSGWIGADFHKTLKINALTVWQASGRSLEYGPVIPSFPVRYYFSMR